MFKKLEKPTLNWNSYLEDFFQSRRAYKRFYQSIKNDYSSSHLTYDSYEADFNKIIPLNIRSYCTSDIESLDRVETLKNLYLSKTSYFCNILNGMRMNNSLLSCPNCGEDGSPNTLDHYLPKAIYPELAVCIYNLVPMCSKCQSEKSTDYKDLNNKIFFHPYYDNYSDDMYILEIIPMPTYKTPSISIKVRNSVPLAIKKLALSQFDGLNLYLRFNNFIVQTYLTTIENLLNSSYDIDKLLILFIDLHVKKGVNNWNIILYKSILENSALINWINQEREK